MIIPSRKKGTGYSVPSSKLLTSLASVGVDRAACPLFRVLLLDELFLGLRRRRADLNQRLRMLRAAVAI